MYETCIFCCRFLVLIHILIQILSTISNLECIYLANSLLLYVLQVTTFLGWLLTVYLSCQVSLSVQKVLVVLVPFCQVLVIPSPI